MSNPRYNSLANSREAGREKLGSYGRGQNNAPTAVEAGAVTTKGVAPAKGKAQEISISKGKESGTALGMGAAVKGGKYTWT